MIIIEISDRSNIDIEFARFFAKKSNEGYGVFKYHHNDAAEILGYNRNA